MNPFNVKIFSMQFFKMQLNQSLMTSVGQVPMNCSGPGIRHLRTNGEPAVRIWWMQLHWSRTGAVFYYFLIYIFHIQFMTHDVRWWNMPFWLCWVLGSYITKLQKMNMPSPLKIILRACIMFHWGLGRGVVAVGKAFLKTSFITLQDALIITNVWMRYCA